MASQNNNRERVDRELRRLGFGGLDDPNLIPSIAFFIKGHDQFRSQLLSVDPEKREHAYNTLRPHLRFTPKPLDVYISEGRRMAEQQQLPGYNPVTGEIIPFKVPEVNIDLLATEALAQNAHEKAGGNLELVCTHCTVAELFPAKTRKQANQEAERGGWRGAGKKAYCPKHVPTRLTMNLACTDCNIVQRIRAWDEQDAYTRARLLGWVIQDSAVCPDCSAKPVLVQ